MKQIKLRAIVAMIICAGFVAGLVLFSINYAVDSESWALYPANNHIFDNGRIVQAGTITDRNGVVLAQTRGGLREFNEDAEVRRATLHAVGDLDRFIRTGLHTSFLGSLTGYNPLTGVYSADGRGNNIRTTLCSATSVEALRAMGNRSGVVGIYNHQTGEVIAMVSTPTFDINTTRPADLSERAQEGGRYEGVFLNRFLSGTFTPGSTFKVVTAAAAIDTLPDALTREYTCRQGVYIDDEWVSCMGRHGTIDLEMALARSCNAYFSQLAVDLGEDVLMRFAENAGFNRRFAMDGVRAVRSFFDIRGYRNIDIAWAGMGQFTTMMNPLQYVSFMGAVANGGVPVRPRLVDRIETGGGVPLNFHINRNGRRMLSRQTADTLKEMMWQSTVLEYGRGNFPGLRLSAKTGTAEVMDRPPHAVFIGFVDDADLPLAFVVLVEHGGGGAEVAGRLANRVLQAARRNLAP